MDEGNYNPLPQTPNVNKLPQPKDMKEFDKQSNQELKPHNRKVVNKSSYELIKWGLWLLFGIVLVLGYAVLNDSFKSDINIPQCPAPAVIPACPESPSCPAFPNLTFPDCTNTCNFPSSIQINLTNSTR